MKRFIFFFSALLLVVGLQAQTTIEAPELGGATVLSEEALSEILAENNVDITEHNVDTTELCEKLSGVQEYAMLNVENNDPDDLLAVSKQLEGITKTKNTINWILYILGCCALGAGIGCLLAI